MRGSLLLKRRKVVNFIMLTITAICTVMAAGVLVYILGYLFIHGATSLTWNFFTKLPTPVGETGGGMANAIVGSAKLLMIAAAVGIPIGFLAGVYLSEFGDGPFAFFVRYVTDLLNGVPSIVMGIFAYTIIVLPQKHFSTLAGGLALGVMMIPIAVRSSRRISSSSLQIVARRGRGIGRIQSHGDLHGGDSRREERNYHRGDAEYRACLRRNRAVAVHQFQQPLSGAKG